jgi:hypothetical protein
LVAIVSASSLFELHSIKTGASVQGIRIQYGRRLPPEEKPNRKKKKDRRRKWREGDKCTQCSLCMLSGVIRATSWTMSQSTLPAFPDRTKENAGVGQSVDASESTTYSCETSNILYTQILCCLFYPFYSPSLLDFGIHLGSRNTPNCLYGSLILDSL